MIDEQKIELQSRVGLFEKEEAELLTKHQLTRDVNLDFPRYKEYPPDLQLALMVLNNHGGKFSFSYVDREKKEPTE